MVDVDEIAAPLAQERHEPVPVDLHAEAGRSGRGKGLRGADQLVHGVGRPGDVCRAHRSAAIKEHQAVDALRPTRIRAGMVIENMVTPSPLDHDQLQVAAADLRAKQEHGDAAERGQQYAVAVQADP